MTVRKKWLVVSFFILPLVFPEVGAAVKYYNKSEIESLIKVGDTNLKVIQLLGSPSNDDLIMAKENDVIIGHRFLYIYAQKEPNIFNGKMDTYLELWFDSNNKVEEINYHVGNQNTPSELK